MTLFNPALLELGPIAFASPLWLWLIPVFVFLTLWIGRKSLSGLGTSTRIAALIARTLVIVLLVSAMAEPQLRKVSKDVAVTAIIDASKSVPTNLQQRVEAFIHEAAAQGKKPEDRLGVITVAKDAFVQTLPSKRVTGVDRQFVGSLNGTNLAAGIQLALATAPKDAAQRLILASDGLETSGSLLQAAQAAKAAGVPIDVIPIRYKYGNEVLVDRVVTPGTAREGQTISVRVVLKATRAASGRLNILENGQAIDLDPQSEALGEHVELAPGTNVLTVQVPVSGRGAHQYDAVFEPDRTASGEMTDSLMENNKGTSVTFASGEGSVLVLRTINDKGVDESAQLVEALEASGIRCDVQNPEQIDLSLTNINSYDAIVMVNQDAYPYSYDTQETLRQYVHDTGGGLVMVGGDKAFGAGGWIGSPLEDALPIKLDPPQKRQMPRGALALVIHSVEMPRGTFYGKQVCNAAVKALSRLDYVGIVEFEGMGGTDWTLPLQLKGDGTAARQAISKLRFGDMPDFDPSLELALQGLMAVDAGQRHVIVISDGDPSLSVGVLKKYRAAGVTISCVGVFPHSNSDLTTMQRMAKYTGGKPYAVTTNGALANLPNIFIKEAQTVKRTLIWEGQPFSPTVVRGAETLRGLTGVPPITGYVVAADREGLAQVLLRGKENDPIAAQWQYGLGRTMTFTSDASTRWAASWVAWDQFKQFWEQQLRWVMRPAGSPNVRVSTEKRDDKTLVVVEAVDNDGRRLPTATFQGRMATPDGKGAPIVLRQVGPGRFEALVDTPESGTYVMSMRYEAPPAVEGGQETEGSVQAAIIKPFADEFRALEDNAAVLRQVAQITGGRVLGEDPLTAELWSREGLTMPVSTRSIWLLVTLTGIGLFLLDVAIRRVRLDVAKAFVAIRRGAHRSKEKAGAQLSGLHAARAKAQAQMAGRVAPSQQDADIARAGGSAHASDPKTAQQARKQQAKRKFEASDEDRKRAVSKPIALGGEAEPGVKPAKKRPVDTNETQQEEQGMSRLLKAKQRAREEMTDD